MVKVIRKDRELNHSGVPGMKWGYNDGKRNGRRTAQELNSLKDTQKRIGLDVSNNIENDYAQADHMLRFLGITLDAHSNDEAVVRSMAIYKQMADTKDRYKNQYDWLKAFSNRLSSIGYDMKAVDNMIDKNKDQFSKISSGAGSEEKSSLDLGKSDSKKSSKKSGSKSSSKSGKSSDKKKDEQTDDKSDESNDKKDSEKTELKPKKSDEEQNKKKAEEEKKKAEEEKKKAEELGLYERNISGEDRPAILNTKNYDSKKVVKKTKKVAHSEIVYGNDELYHHGILGQKWGVRRYQNKDGSLTTAGRKRYGNYDHLSDDELRSQINRKRLENRYKDLKVGNGSGSVSNAVDQTANKASKVVKTKYGKNSNVTKTTNAVGDVAKDTARIYDKVNEAKSKSNKNKIDLSNMSDAEIQKAINRMQMELEMSKLDSSDVKRGKKITSDTLQTIGLVASTAVDVITLGILIEKVIKKV